jgi:hypothetical protein
MAKFERRKKNIEHNLKEYKRLKKNLDILKTCVINPVTVGMYYVAKRKVDAFLENLIGHLGD